MDVVDVALAVAEALERVGVPYFLGGSLASSLQGEPRATNDIDVVVELAEEQVVPLAAALGPDFDVDVEALRRAARERRSWNVIHAPSLIKIDLFVAGESAFDRSELSRRERLEVLPGRTLWVKRPEDSVLRKLLWYRSGGGVSDRQWRDVVEVLRQSRAVIDPAYLDEWAPRLGVADLLAKARAHAGEGSSSG